MATIRSQIAAVATARGLTSISTVARNAGLSRSTVRRLWNRPMPRYVKFSTITRLCHALDATCGELLIYEPDIK